MTGDPGYGAALAGVYEDVFRGRGKDWAAEARHVTSLVRSRCPDARSLLDVACGTGAHLATFAERFDRAEGLELAPAMRERARVRLPGVPVHAGDMRDFSLGTTFDAVTCLFAAIAYVDDESQLRAATAAMAAHLRPGGVLVVEPWWFADRFVDGFVSSALVENGGRTIARVSHSTRVDGATRMQTRFIVASADGIDSFTEIDVLRLFTEDEYLAAFAAAGLTVEHHGDVPPGRGLFVGVRT
jgi:dTDP-3-amino-3,4,6-trideoxy-alpha-D-glucopyranose N,N-dimethyltransferase/N-dimethyltransferase